MKASDVERLEGFLFKGYGGKDISSIFWEEPEKIEQQLSGFDQRLLLASGISRIMRENDTYYLSNLLEGYIAYSVKKKVFHSEDTLGDFKVECSIDIWKAGMILDYNLDSVEQDKYYLLPPKKATEYLEENYFRPKDRRFNLFNDNQIISYVMGNINKMKEVIDEQGEGIVDNYLSDISALLRALSKNRQLDTLKKLINGLLKIDFLDPRDYIYYAARMSDWSDALLQFEASEYLPPGREERFLDDYYDKNMMYVRKTLGDKRR